MQDGRGTDAILLTGAHRDRCDRTERTAQFVTLPTRPTHWAWSALDERTHVSHPQLADPSTDPPNTLSSSTLCRRPVESNAAAMVYFSLHALGRDGISGVSITGTPPKLVPQILSVHISDVTLKPVATEKLSFLC